jgi:hypothetical protein
MKEVNTTLEKWSWGQHETASIDLIGYVPSLAATADGREQRAEAGGSTYLMFPLGLGKGQMEEWAPSRILLLQHRGFNREEAAGVSLCFKVRDESDAGAGGVTNLTFHDG